MGALKAITVALVCVGLSGCFTSNRVKGVTVNGLSLHVNSKKERNEFNHGLGVVFKNSTQCGYYRNSRMKVSYSAYCKRKVISIGRIYASSGIAIYDNKNGYRIRLMPIFSLGIDIPVSRRVLLRANYHPSSLVTLQAEYRFR